MRLIDADLLKQNCKCTGEFEDNFKGVDLITLASVIDAQPTAYNVDEVVKEVKEISMKWLGEVRTCEVIKTIRKGGV
jgi:hypothetical protein